MKDHDTLRASFPSIIVRSLEETERAARAIARAVSPGTCVALTGPLGAGKTSFCRALGAALGVDGLKSPTFAIESIREASGVKIVHADLYRLDDVEDELDSLSEHLDEGARVFVEWAEKIDRPFAERRVDVAISPIGGDSRAIDITARGSSSLSDLSSAFSEIEELWR